MEEITIRPGEAGDVDRLHAINQAAVPQVGSVTRQELTRLMFEFADLVLVALSDDDPIGFVVCMVEGLDYDSLNYAWISDRYVTFAYVDRVAVSERARGFGIGAKLYGRVFRHFTGKRPVVMAEVNLAPPNPGSVRFHERMGFRDVGERWQADGAKGVVYLERSLVDLNA